MTNLRESGEGTPNFALCPLLHKSCEMDWLYFKQPHFILCLMAVVIKMPSLPNGYKILYGSFMYTGITISHKQQLMHTYIINTTLLPLCYSNMFQPSKGHPQGA
jgi:hypothetical protein